MPAPFLHFPSLAALPLRHPPLAQFNPYDDPPPPPPPPPRPMSFSDLKDSIRDVQSGNTDSNLFRNGVLSLLAVLALVVLILHFKQRHQNAVPTVPNNLGRLGRELGRHVPFPLGSKLTLKWVARATRTPFPALLLSSELFDQCVAQWSGQPTFALARSWGKSRLASLRSVLFG